MFFPIQRTAFQLFQKEIEKDPTDGLYLITQKFNAAMIAISIVITLFILAIVSPWIFPNKMVSKNEHDVKH